MLVAEAIEILKSMPSNASLYFNDFASPEIGFEYDHLEISGIELSDSNPFEVILA